MRFVAPHAVGPGRGQLEIRLVHERRGLERVASTSMSARGEVPMGDRAELVIRQLHQSVERPGDASIALVPVVSVRGLRHVTPGNRANRR